MQVPIEIVFQNTPPSEELREEILRQAARLERFSDRITSCRVVVHAPETRHRHGDRFRIDVRIAMPQHKDVLVTHAPGDEPEAEHPHVAVAKAFGAAQRQIEDAMRVMRGQTKLHLPADHGVVARFLAEEPCDSSRRRTAGRSTSTATPCPTVPSTGCASGTRCASSRKRGRRGRKRARCTPPGAFMPDIMRSEPGAARGRCAGRPAAGARR